MKNIQVWFQRVIRSKTLWFNAIVAGLAALESGFSILQPFLPGNVFTYISVLLLVGNPILRVLTTQALADK